VTGSQNIKFGYQGAYLVDDRIVGGGIYNSASLTYRTQNGIPDQLTEVIAGNDLHQRVEFHALYGQEQLTLGRATVQGALRYDHAFSFYPAQTLGGVRFLPTVTAFPRTQGVKGYNDLWPRGGVAYDAFGNGHTSLKFNFGRYLEAAQNGGLFTALNPTGRVSTSASRSWTDTNGNWIPDCDLLNTAAQSPATTGSIDTCGANTNANFGSPVFDSTLDPGLLSGWGVRSGDWQWGASVQQQVLPRVSAELSYLRRWLVNFPVTDNRARAPEDHTQFGIVAPSDSRLPNGGGYTIAGLYDVAPSLFGQVSNLIIDSSNFGKWSQHFDGIDITFNFRTQGGFSFQGGTSTGRNVADACDVRAHLPELSGGLGAGLAGSTVSPTSPYCHVNYGVLTQLRGASSYTVPKIDVLVSGLFQSKPGPLVAANYAMPSSVIAQSLGRAPAGNPANVTINLIEPGTLYGNRINQLDFRVAKLLKFASTRSMVGVDLYNAFNANPILSYNNTFVPGGSWLQPISVLTGRMARISVQFDF